MTGQANDRDRQPTRLSAALAVGLTALTVLVLLWELDDIAWPVALGVVGAVLFGLSCWLLARDRLEPVARPLVSLLALPVAIGLFGSGALAALLLASRLFPVPEVALFSTTALRIAGHVGVVLGVVLAVLGISLGARTRVTPAVLRQYGQTTFLTALVPGLFCVAVVGQTLVVSQDGPNALGGDIAGLLWEWVTAAGSPVFAFAGFLFTVALAVTGVLGAVVVLPVAELDGSSAAKRRESALISRLSQLAAVVIVFHLAALGLELTLSTEELASLVGPAAYDLLTGVARSRVLRLFLLAVAALALGSAAIALVTRWLANRADQPLGRGVGPAAGGVVITVVAVTVAETVYETVLELVFESLPQATQSDVERMATEAAATYGEELFVVLLAFVLVTATLCFIVLLRLALTFGYLPETAPGFALASTGLFLAVIAAGTVGARTPVVFGGVVASLIVWDAGQFGATLGREVGTTTATRETELLHTGATLGVGLCGVAAAWALYAQAETVLSVASATESVALVALAVGLGSFVIALR
ncbi:hypothetical protein SAMN05216226_11099 [Halovenus aranensis]|uniref:Uncharacterized protein n=1 Tax=Halovenus aranensis TaxID=890420 RepID=A0A1G8X4E0_9EURY|nr:hypothetical protein [Halovenus aranensis]SDJ85314.1 hypothetical protein SAMN05216226_11099 [Halovenus aranensis]